jgi:hypothetical protein
MALRPSVTLPEIPSGLSGGRSIPWAILSPPAHANPRIPIQLIYGPVGWPLISEQETES